ncbi:MAG: hypothetical protein MSS61_05435 [Bacteroidales bacterium]|nr:hypothetical protein [Bacteroidales bacterium]
MKGRDKQLLSLRDRKLYERYYYWTEVRRLRFDDALRILSEREFFISEGRIIYIIRNMIANGYEMENGVKLGGAGFLGFKVSRHR